MRKPRIYLETTMFNHYFDEDREAHAATVELFKAIQAGQYEAYTSGYVIEELEDTKDEIKRSNMLALINEYDIVVLPDDTEAAILADMYVNEGVFRMRDTGETV